MLRVASSEGVWLLRVEGGSAPQNAIALRKAIADLAEDTENAADGTGSRVVVDLTATPTLGLRMLVVLADGLRILRGQQGDLRLACLRPARDSTALVLSGLIQIFDSTAAAVASYGGEPPVSCGSSRGFETRATRASLGSEARPGSDC